MKKIKTVVSIILMLVITIVITFFAVRHFFPRVDVRTELEYVYDTTFIEIEVPVIKEIVVPSIKYVTIKDTVVEYKNVYVEKEEITPEFARSPLFTFEDGRYEGLMTYYFESGDFNFQYSKLKEVIAEKKKKKKLIGLSIIAGYDYSNSQGEFGFGFMCPKITDNLEILLTTKSVLGRFRFN